MLDSPRPSSAGGCTPRGATRLAGALVVVAVLGLVVGFVLAASIVGSSRARVVQQALEQERADSERALARQRRELQDLETRARDQAEVFHILPDLVRQMFAVGTRRNVPPVALKLLNQLFEPTQAAVFHARPSDRKITLLAGSGLPSSVTNGYEIEYGEGRVGYVAENNMALDEADFRNATATTRRHLEATAHRELLAETVAPSKTGTACSA